MTFQDWLNDAIQNPIYGIVSFLVATLMAAAAYHNLKERK